jgi:superfamily II DNA or RNA helicase
MSFLNIKFPVTLKISSTGEMIPLQFFGEVIPVAKKIQFKLGYFSSNSISTLSYGFAQFIYNGGTIDFLINHFVTENDYKLINDDFVLDSGFYNSIEKNIINDLEKLNDVLTKRQVNHFYNCLRFLIENNRVNIIPVTTKTGEISHFKEALFWDNDNNVINIVGSCNFTYKGIVCNGESFVINRSWGETSEKANISYEIKEYQTIFKKESKDFIYLNPENLINIVKDNSVSLTEKQLLEEELNLVDINSETYTQEEIKIKNVNSILKQKFIKTIEQIITKPKFPFGKPRDYQLTAYNNWINNGHCGLFAMATGTGKTITSLNCILEESQKNKGYYKFIVLVPTKALVDQWEKEISKQFNFQKLISIKSKYFYEELKYDDEEESSCILVTYATFKSVKFQNVFNKISYKEKFTLIADEAHNMGSSGFINVLNSLNPIKRRIGLSATPSRYFDEIGEKIVYDFFKIEIKDDEPNFTFSFNISEAINKKPKPFLCPYEYRIKFVSLEKDELDRYRYYTRLLMNYIDKNGVLKKCVEVENFLKLRKDVIKKARRKKEKLIKIIEEIGVENFKFAFVYVPEGNEIDYTETDSDWNEGDSDEEKKIISEYTISINKHFGNSIAIGHFTGETKERELILNQFSTGKLQALFAMKCLDEGVDIPRTEIAIFCSSTGNPRQYVQRRGRVLRLHDNKEKAIIYDMIVIPLLSELNDNSKEYNCEKNLVESELKRLIDFAKDSLSYDDVLLNKDLNSVCEFFKIDMNKYIN